jgi:PAS domain S-box-containing protein
VKDFIYTFDISGRFTYSNQSLLDLLGITLEQIVGKTFHELPYPTELATTLQAQIQQVVDTGKPLTAETPYTNPAGNPGYYEYIFVPIFDKDGKVVLVAGSTRDITERRQLEQRKDEFISIASHELKTPLTSIKGYTQLLERSVKGMGNATLNLYLARTNIYVDRLNGLIADLLDVSRIQAGRLDFNLTEFDFDELVKEGVENIQLTAMHHKIEIVGKAATKITADRNRLEQVINNLLTNAIKYSPEADKVVISVKKIGGQVEVAVRDFGIGISKVNHSNIFERFYRVETSAKNFSGLGIGLFISYEIIKRLEGNLKVESEEGKGSVFTFTLPISQSIKDGLSR